MKTAYRWGIFLGSVLGIAGIATAIVHGGHRINAMQGTNYGISSPPVIEASKAEINSDDSTITIKYSENTGEFGRDTYIFQQFDEGKECVMRYLEFQECPNARRNNGVNYSCNGTAMRDLGCDGIVDELYSAEPGSGVITLTRDLMATYSGIVQRVDGAYRDMHSEMELMAGINLEDEVNKWENARQ